MDDTLKQYEVEPDGFWFGTYFYGDGVDVAELAEKRGWEVIGNWGRGCYDLGSHPYVIVFFRDRESFFDVIEYSEGAVTMYACPSEEIREQITNELAFFHWKNKKRNAPPAMDQYNSATELPEALKDPCRYE